MRTSLLLASVLLLTPTLASAQTSVSESLALAQAHYDAERYDDALRVLASARQSHPGVPIDRMWARRLAGETIAATPEAAPELASSVRARPPYVSWSMHDRVPDDRVDNTALYWIGAILMVAGGIGGIAAAMLANPPNIFGSTGGGGGGDDESAAIVGGVAGGTGALGLFMIILGGVLDGEQSSTRPGRPRVSAGPGDVGLRLNMDF